MLADQDDESAKSSQDISIAITQEMYKPISGATDQRQDQDMDFDNMEYMPQPTDANPDFQKANDSISHLLSLYDREQFVGVLKNILGEHLLKITDEAQLERETHLLELFKSRFGEDKLQACEVMLQDIINSRRLFIKIHRMADFETASRNILASKNDFSVQILSSFFWPEMRDDEFFVPGPIQDLQKSYEAGFESHHNMMKLQWLPSLGRTTVELELADRTVTESVPPWVASVIYQFGDDQGDADAPKTVAELSQKCEMGEPLVRNAISFWVGKKVLTECESGKWVVLESLENGSQGVAAAAAPVVEEELSAVRSAQDLLEENGDMYRLFVQAMLTNQGNMPFARIFMMLKMTMPGGFPFAEPEVRGLLQGMIANGTLTQNGDVYSVRR